MNHLYKYCECGWGLFDTEVEDCPLCHKRLSTKVMGGGQHGR